MKFAQYLIMCAVGCALIWFQENVYHQKINPYIMVACIVGVPYLLTLAYCRLADWHASALHRQEHPHRFVGVEPE